MIVTLGHEINGGDDEGTNPTQVDATWGLVSRGSESESEPDEGVDLAAADDTDVEL